MTQRDAVAAPDVGFTGTARKTPLQRLGRLTRQNPAGMFFVGILVIVILSAITADFITPYDPQSSSVNVLEAPSVNHIFGTDSVGRDMFSRVIAGGQVSLYVGFLSVAIGMVGGVILGLASGYFEGPFDLIVQRVVDAMLAIPPLVLAMALVAVLGPSTNNALLVIGILIIPSNTRVVRSAVLSVKQNPYIDAAKVIGATNVRIISRYVLPNVMAPVIILASVWLGNAILIEASLSFLGLGTQAPDISWGYMLGVAGRRYMESAPWIAIFPGLAISLTVLAFNMVGDMLRDVLDPRLRLRG